MNVFKLLVTGILAVIVLSLFFSEFAAIFFLPTELSKHTQTLLLEAQGDLGQTKSVTLSFKSGQTMHARNLDEPTRTVAFACATEFCCETLNECTQPFSATPDRLKINKSLPSILSARCVPLSGLHACTVYVGKEPAQLDLTETSIPQTLEMEGVTPLPIQTTLHNRGEIATNRIVVRVELIENQVFGGVEKPITIANVEKEISQLESGEERAVELSISVQRVGIYTVILRASSPNAGFEEEKYTLTVIGNETSLCAPDLSKNEAPFLDGLDNVCRKKMYCNGCTFTYECREAWEKIAPSGLDYYYDPARGEPSFTYQTWPPQNGQCE